MKIGVDVMGGDFAPEAAVAGAVLAVKAVPASVKLVLLGDRDVMVPLIEKNGGNTNDFEIVHAPDVIGMGEHPTKAFSKT